MTMHEESGKRWLKADLHTHCNLDPTDCRMIRYTSEQLIQRAADLEYRILGITCHNIDVWTPALSDYAKDLGITLIPGMEVYAERTRHVLVYNFQTGPETINTLEKIKSRRREDTLVIAPHPFFPGNSCLHGFLEKNPDVFDAVEYSGFQIRGFNFNKHGLDFVRRTGKPMVGCGDIHTLWQLNRTFTWIYAEPNVASIIQAIKQGQVRYETSPLSWLEAAAWWCNALWRMIVPVNAKPPKPQLDELSPARD
jgi:predicted metal-dependent phosphoesterase TrpH